MVRSECFGGFRFGAEAAFTLRWATYSLGGFKEGMSLTVVDELARWQKYAYGKFFLYPSFSFLKLDVDVEFFLVCLRMQ